MPASVVYSVAAALKARLAARSNLSGVQVTLGVPWQPGADYIAIVAADPHEQRQSGLRPVPAAREEEFTLEVILSCIRKGDADHADVWSRAYTLAAELEDELADDPTINSSLGNGWAQTDGLPVRTYVDETGTREARITARVACRARIT